MNCKFLFSSTEDEALIALENNKVIFDNIKKNTGIFFKDDIWKNISEEVWRSSVQFDSLLKIKKPEFK